MEHTVYCPNGNPRPVSIIPPNSFFAQNISFRMFPSLEFSYVVYMVIHVNLITAKRGIILKIFKRKNIHLKLWHLYEKKNKVRNPQPFLQTLTIYMGRFNELFLVSWIFHVIFQLVASQLHEENITIIMPKLQCAHKQCQTHSGIKQMKWGKSSWS